MEQASSPLTTLSEAQRTQALERFTIIRPALEREITQAQVARTYQISLRTVQRWIKYYRERGLVKNPLRLLLRWRSVKPFGAKKIPAGMSVAFLARFTATMAATSRASIWSKWPLTCIK